MILGVKTYEKSGKLPRKEVYNLAYSDGAHNFGHGLSSHAYTYSAVSALLL